MKRREFITLIDGVIAAAGCGVNVWPLFEVKC